MAVCWCYKGKDVFNVLHVDSAGGEYFLLQVDVDGNCNHRCAARPLCTYLSRLPTDVRGDNVRMMQGRNAPRYTYGIRTWLLRALPCTTCGGVASCRGNLGKRHVTLAQCIGLIRITSYWRYGVPMLTVQALRTSARDTYPVDRGNKPRIWAKNHIRELDKWMCDRGFRCLFGPWISVRCGVTYRVVCIFNLTEGCWDLVFVRWKREPVLGNRLLKHASWTRWMSYAFLLII